VKIDLAVNHPVVVSELLKLADQARADIGDHDRIGQGMRFSDPAKPRPVNLKTNFGRGKLSKK
jgi:hypothetical protein